MNYSLWKEKDAGNEALDSDDNEDMEESADIEDNGDKDDNGDFDDNAEIDKDENEEKVGYLYYLCMVWKYFFHV